MKLFKGFTLIELVVVMAVFLFIIGAAIGILLSIFQNQKRVLAEQQYVNQISYVEEYMSKALRMANTDTTGSCLGSNNVGYIYLLDARGDVNLYKGIKFINASDNNACEEFYFNSGIIYEQKGSNSAVALTSADLQFDTSNPIRFSINGKDGSIIGQGCINNSKTCGATNADSIQPRVTITMNILIPGDGLSTGAACSSTLACSKIGEACDLSTNTCTAVKTIQTTVSRRNLNVFSSQ